MNAELSSEHLLPECSTQESWFLSPVTLRQSNALILRMMARQRIPAIWYWLTSAIFLLLLFVPLFLYNMHQGLNHDEHQFVASAWLWKHEQLRPYRDFPYFHLPYLIYLNALLFDRGLGYILTARLVAQVSGWLILVVLFAQTMFAWRDLRGWRRFWLAVAITGLLASTPLFMFTSGRAWNQDLATLLAVLSTLSLVHGLQSKQSTRIMMLLSGLFLGLGIGTRLTLTPLVFALLAGIWICREGSRRERLSLSLWFLSGCLLASIPLFSVAAQDWDSFWFDNFVYPRLNTLFRSETDYARAMSLLDKLVFLGRDVLLAEPRNLILPVAYLAIGIAYPPTRVLSTRQVGVKMIALMMPFLAIAALAPTPAWHQYFFVLYPFLALGVMWGLREFHARWVSYGWFWICLAVLVITNTTLWWGEYQRELRLVGPDRWYPTEVQRIGQQIASLVKPHERVLTVSPIYVLEGNRSIYPELATGPFAFRAANYLSDERRRQFGFIAPAEQLDSFFGQELPRAILTGADPKEEAGLVEYALRHHYASLPLDGYLTLWLRPRATWDGEIELVTVTHSSDVFQPDELLNVMLFLRSISPMERNYSVSVSLIGQDGSVPVRQDHWPWGRPTSTWPVGELWYDGHDLRIPTDVPPGIYAISVRLYDAGSGTILPIADESAGGTQRTDYIAGYVEIDDGFSPMAKAVAGEVRFGDHLRLAGYDWQSPAADVADPMLNLTLIWQGDGTLNNDAKVFVHVVDAAGRMVAQRDQRPLDGFYPMSEWLPQQLVADAYRLSFPRVPPEEPYTVMVGIYEPTTGERYPVTVDGRTYGDAFTLMTYP